MVLHMLDDWRYYELSGKKGNTPTQTPQQQKNDR